MVTLAFAFGEAPLACQGREVNKWHNEDGSVLARAFSRDDNHWIEWRGLGVFAFSSGSDEVRVWRDECVPRADVADAFSRMLQPIVLQALGWQALHAGAAAGPKGVLAFSGRAGSGKSTLAFAMGQAGWQQFADDALVLRSNRDCVMVYPLPFTPRLRRASRAHFVNACRPQPTSPKSRPAGLPLAAIFLLKQNARLADPRVSLLPRARAFSEVLTHAHCFDAGDPMHTRRLVADYLEIVERIPVFTLEYRPSFEDLPELIRSVTEAAGSTGTSVAEPIDWIARSRMRSQH